MAVIVCGEGGKEELEKDKGTTHIGVLLYLIEQSPFIVYACVGTMGNMQLLMDNMDVHKGWSNC